MGIWPINMRKNWAQQFDQSWEGNRPLPLLGKESQFGNTHVAKISIHAWLFNMCKITSRKKSCINVFLFQFAVEYALHGLKTKYRRSKWVCLNVKYTRIAWLIIVFFFFVEHCQQITVSSHGWNQTSYNWSYMIALLLFSPEHVALIQVVGWLNHWLTITTVANHCWTILNHYPVQTTNDLTIAMTSCR